MGHGGVAASRGDGDLYKMLGGRDSAASGPASRYSKADSLGRGRDLANVSDFSTSADMKMDSVDAKQGSSSNSNSEDDEDGSGESDLAQSSDFATGGSGARRSGFSGPSSKHGRRGSQNQDTENYSSDEYNSENEKERRRQMDVNLALSAEEREERARLRKMEEIRQRWLNPDKTGAGVGGGITVAASGSALDMLEESTGDKKGAELSQESSIGGLNQTAGSDLPETEADKLLNAEAEALLMQQMVDPNPANANIAAKSGAL